MESSGIPQGIPGKGIAEVSRGEHLGRFRMVYAGWFHRSVPGLGVRRQVLSCLGSATSYFAHFGVATLTGNSCELRSGPTGPLGDLVRFGL